MIGDRPWEQGTDSYGTNFGRISVYQVRFHSHASQARVSPDEPRPLIVAVLMIGTAGLSLANMPGLRPGPGWLHLLIGMVNVNERNEKSRFRFK